MDVGKFLKRLTEDPDYRGELAGTRLLPPREARFELVKPPLPEPLSMSLAEAGIRQLYTHQAEAVRRARAGENLVVLAATAGGKTLCYNLPVVETLLKDPKARALYIFPTKALAQDQLRGLRQLAARHPDLEKIIQADTYDGDTPKHRRKKIRENCRIILTNPDMLHVGVLPNHARWGPFLSGLRFVVIDEAHTYRGVFGSHTACVIRRLRRIAGAYRARPRFLLSSATIANPLELAEALVGEEVGLIDNDGSPQGGKRFVFWNPAPLKRSGTADPAGGGRRSPNMEAVKLLAALAFEGVQTICFTRARVLAELICRYARERLQGSPCPELADRIKPYRGGFLAEDRRKIEKELFEGRLLAITSTIALELGIDVGTLEAAILVGFPGTIASTWQQAGRAGRSREESLVTLVAHNDPIDQFLIRHPEYLFERSPEHAIVDTENVYILTQHLSCAAKELPLTDGDSAYFGPLTEALMRILVEEGRLACFEGRTFWSSPEDPAMATGLRSTTEEEYEIVIAEGNKTIGALDGTSAFLMVHPGATYLHEGEIYLVKDLDLPARKAWVVPRDLDYYTMPNTSGRVTLRETQLENPSALVTLGLGDVTITWKVTSFTKIKFYSSERIGTERLELPEQEIETTALWIRPHDTLLVEIEHAGIAPVDALAGVRNLILTALPMLAMCDRQDLGGMVDIKNFEQPAVFVYDRHSGGLGFAQKGFESAGDLLRACYQIVEECPCHGGCPSCVGISGLTTNITQEPDEQGRFPFAHKEGALIVLDILRGAFR